GFTAISEQLSPAQLVAEIDACFKAFDAVIEKYRIEKIKTIGDAYMAAGGLPDPANGPPQDVVLAALELQEFMARHGAEREAAGLPAFQMRVGIHTGPVVAGIVGVKKFAYDIWGDTVNIAARLESAGEAGRINLSRATYERVAGSFRCTSRGLLPVKNADPVDMYFVDGPRAPAHAARLEER
ncbi:MAG: adenylate/guanylate cyclase domain-containing protein, partial [Myxococcales bacterium]|nr:adenylate/guanylate cyclase domain-containing protein [Myxococcales bacterium]